MKPDKLVAAILATDYIKNVLVILAINTSVPVPATLVVLAPLAAESILPAFAPAVMNGKMVVAK